MNKYVDNASLVKFFFKQSVTDPSIYYCQNEKCQPKRGMEAKGYKQNPGKGFTNLRNHLRSCVGPNFEDVYNNYLKKCGGRIDNFYYTCPKDADVFKGMEWDFMRSQPITEVDNQITKGILNVKPISSNSLLKYVLSLVPLVEDEIRRRLPEKFGILFDGWTDSCIHYVAVFATYMCEDEYNETMLACAQLPCEQNMTADNHEEFLSETLDVYEKKLEHVACLIGDNCAVNQKLYSITGIPLIGCCAHKFNLAVDRWISAQPQFPEALRRIRDLKAQLSPIKHAKCSICFSYT